MGVCFEYAFQVDFVMLPFVLIVVWSSPVLEFVLVGCYMFQCLG